MKKIASILGTLCLVLAIVVACEPRVEDTPDDGDNSSNGGTGTLVHAGLSKNLTNGNWEVTNSLGPGKFLVSFHLHDGTDSEGTGATTTAVFTYIVSDTISPVLGNYPHNATFDAETMNSGVFQYIDGTDIVQLQVDGGNGALNGLSSTNIDVSLAIDVKDPASGNPEGSLTLNYSGGITKK